LDYFGLFIFRSKILLSWLKSKFWNLIYLFYLFCLNVSKQLTTLHCYQVQRISWNHFWGGELERRLLRISAKFPQIINLELNCYNTFEHINCLHEQWAHAGCSVLYHIFVTAQEIEGQLDTERKFQERILAEDFGTSKLSKIRKFISR